MFNVLIICFVFSNVQFDRLSPNVQNTINKNGTLFTARGVDSAWVVEVVGWLADWVGTWVEWLGG